MRQRSAGGATHRHVLPLVLSRQLPSGLSVVLTMMGMATASATCGGGAREGVRVGDDDDDEAAAGWHCSATDSSRRGASLQTVTAAL